MAVVDWGGEAVVVVDWTHIGAALMTSTAPRLAMVSLNMVVVRGVGSCWLPWAGLGVAGSLLCGEAGYRVQLMRRLRSEFKEFCEALEDIRALKSVDGSSSS